MRQNERKFIGIPRCYNVIITPPLVNPRLLYWLNINRFSKANKKNPQSLRKRVNEKALKTNKQLLAADIV